MSISIATNLLVVDASESVRKAIIQKLRALGAQRCLEAENGIEALDILKQQTVDVILCDSDLLQISGLELLKMIRTDAKLCSITFILITNESNRDYLLEAIKYGVSDVLVKPYTFDCFGDHIEKAIKNPLKTAVPLVTKNDIPEIFTKKIDPLTLLIVDNEPDCLELLSKAFQDEYRILTAENGTKALEICATNKPPDLVLLSVIMPDIGGFEVARRMREQPNSQYIPVIFITRLNDNASLVKGLDLGAVEFVTKPVDIQILKFQVRNFMYHVKLHKQLQGDYDAMIENARLRDVIEKITCHDLKVPLMGIVHLAETMLKSGVFNAKQLLMIEEIALQAAQTINLSIEIYKIETGNFRFNPQPVNIDTILQRLIETARETFHSIRLEFLSDAGKTPSIVLGDATLCYSLFHNLINNACEYANAKSCVTISTSHADSIKITITNEGVVEPKFRKNFFEKYLDTISTKWGGSYSAKLLAEVQHGCIALDVSDEDNLTTVTVYLPKFVTDCVEDNPS